MLEKPTYHHPPSVNELKTYPERSFSAQNLLNIILKTPHLQEFINKQPSNRSILLNEDETAAKISIGNWFDFKLRTRSRDGLINSPTPLTQWPYNNPSDNPDVYSVEESTYWLDPNYPLTDHFSKEESRFIRNPYEEIPFQNPTESNLKNWSNQFSHLIQNPLLPFPGYFSMKNIPGIRIELLHASEEELADLGYTSLAAVPTWWHVMEMYHHLGFEFESPTDKNQVVRLEKALKERVFTEPSLDHHGEKMMRILKSWLVIYQFWAELAEQQGYIPEELSNDNRFTLRDDNGKLITYPLSPTHNLWMSKNIRKT